MVALHSIGAFFWQHLGLDSSRDRYHWSNAEGRRIGHLPLRPGRFTLSVDRIVWAAHLLCRAFHRICRRILSSAQASRDDFDPLGCFNAICIEDLGVWQ